MKQFNNTVYVKYLYFLVFLSPGLALLVALRRISAHGVKKILFLSFALFGFTMLMYGDAYTHLERFQLYQQSLSLGQFTKGLLDLIVFRPVSREIPYSDPYLYIVSSIVGFLGLNGRFIFLITSAIYGYFFVSSIYLVRDHLNGRWTRLLLLVFIFFITWKAFSGMVSVRNWTASWVLFYGLLKYHQTGNRKHLLWCIITPYFHFAYLFISSIVLVVFFGPRWRWVYVILFGLSFLPIKSGSTLLRWTPNNEFLNQKAQNYTIEEDEWDKFIEKKLSVEQEQNFHKIYTRITMRYGIWVWAIMIIIIFYFKYYKSIRVRYLDRFLFVGLALLALSNFAREINPVLSHRLLVNSGYYLMLVLMVLIFYYQYQISRLLSGGLWMGMILLGLNLYFEVSITLKALDLKYFFSPLSYFWLFEESFSVKSLLKQLFF